MKHSGALFAVCIGLSIVPEPLFAQVTYATTIESGEFQGANIVSDNAHSWGYSAGSEPLRIVGGSFRGGSVSGGNAHSYGLWSDGGSFIDISGGVFSGGDADGGNPHSYGIFNNGGTLSISGGAFSGGGGRTSTGVLNNGGVVTVSGGDIGSLANNGGSVYLYAEEVALGSGLSLNINGQIAGLGRISGRWRGSPTFWSIDITDNNTNSWSGGYPGIFLPPDTDLNGIPDRDQSLIDAMPQLTTVAVADDAIRLSWKSESNKQYRVWLKSDLNARWVPQQPVLDGTGGPIEWSFPLNGLARAFAKIQVLAVPKSLQLASVWTSITWSGSVPWQYQPPNFSGVYLGQQRVGTSAWVTLNFVAGTQWPVTISEIRLPQGLSSDYAGPTVVRPSWQGGGSVTLQMAFNEPGVVSQVLQVISDADNATLELPLIVEVLPRHLPEVVQSGRWNDPSTWYDGILPTADDEVYLNGHTVTIDANASAKVITNQPQDLYSNRPWGGKLVVHDGVSITAGIYSGSEPLINYAGSGEITIHGTVEGSRSNGYVRGIDHSGSGTINVIGSVRGGWGGYTYGIENTGSGTINVVGTVSLGKGGYSYAIVNTSRGTVTINGEPSTDLLFGVNPSF